MSKQNKTTINKAANQWLQSSNHKIRIMTDEDFKISTFGEMIEVDDEYLKEIVENKNFSALKNEIGEIIDKILEIDNLSGWDKLEAIQKIDNFKQGFFTIWQHSGVLGIDSQFYQLLQDNNVVN